MSGQGLFSRSYGSDYGFLQQQNCSIAIITGVHLNSIQTLCLVVKTSHSVLVTVIQEFVTFTSNNGIDFSSSVILGLFILIETSYLSIIL